MREFGLIGKSLSHSFSKSYFEEKFLREGISDATYSLFEMTDIGQFPSFLQSHPDLSGLNVTIPYKQAIIPFLNDLSEEAASVGAVNTICVRRVGGLIKTTGHNTDVIGFRQSLRALGQPTQALVLGTGGAAASVVHVLQGLGCRCTVVSRNPQRGLPYQALTPEEVSVNLLIVNCTPVGTYPNICEKPDIPYEGITARHCLYDLVYNPAVTAFLQEGLSRGAQAINGLNMLHIQADAAWQLWNS
jgi:shikimate dehydrogenase